MFEITIPAVRRATVLRATVRSMLSNLDGLLTRDLQVFCNIDPVGDSPLNDVLSVFTDNFSNCITKSNQSFGSLNYAIKWLWAQPREEIFLHIEDDVEFVRHVNLDAMMAIMLTHPEMAYLQIPRSPLTGQESSHLIQHEYTNDGFCWRQGKYRMSFGPGLVRRDFARKAAELIKPHPDPEIQFHMKNEALQEWESQWEYATFGSIGDVKAVSDTGRVYRNNRWKKVVTQLGTTWKSIEK